MATTPNYGWVTPAPTDFITDLPADFETFADAVDDTVKDLNPGTTAGDVDYYTSSTAKARLAIGTAGQVLAVNSGATAPEWVTSVAGGLTQLATGTLSGATTSVTGLSTGYKDLVIRIRNFDPTNDGSGLQIRLNQDSNASRHFTSSTFGQQQNIPFTGTTITITADQDNSVNQGLHDVTIPDYANTTTWKLVQFLTVGNNPTTTTNLEGRIGYGIYNQINAITSLDFIVAGGAAGGTYIIYGAN